MTQIIFKFAVVWITVLCLTTGFYIGQYSANARFADSVYNMLEESPILSNMTDPNITIDARKIDGDSFIIISYAENSTARVWANMTIEHEPLNISIEETYFILSASTWREVGQEVMQKYLDEGARE